MNNERLAERIAKIEQMQKNKELQKTIEDSLERNLNILIKNAGEFVGDPTKTEPAGKLVLPVELVLLLHKAVAANLAQVLQEVV